MGLTASPTVKVRPRNNVTVEKYSLVDSIHCTVHLILL